MFQRKIKHTIDSLVGISTNIDGHIRFKGGLRIDGHIKGNVIAHDSESSMLVISEHAQIEGDVHAAHVIINGTVLGAVHSSDILELQPKGNITGNIHYKTLEMHPGAVISGTLIHQHNEEPVLKLASSNA